MYSLYSKNIYFLDFIYLFMRYTETQRRKQKEKQAPCGEPDVGLHTRTPGSRPEPKASAQSLSHPGIPYFIILFYFILFYFILFYILFYYFLFLKIYLFIHERHRLREKQRHRQREKQAPRREPDGGLDPQTRIMP